MRERGLEPPTIPQGNRAGEGHGAGDARAGAGAPPSPRVGRSAGVFAQTGRTRAGLRALIQKPLLAKKKAQRRSSTKGGREPPPSPRTGHSGGAGGPHPLGEGHCGGAGGPHIPWEKARRRRCARGGLEPPPPSHRGGYSAGARGRANSAGAREKIKDRTPECAEGRGGGLEAPQIPRGRGCPSPLGRASGLLRPYGVGWPRSPTQTRGIASHSKTVARAQCEHLQYLRSPPPGPLFVGGRWGVLGGGGRDSFGFRLEL